MFTDSAAMLSPARGGSPTRAISAQAGFARATYARARFAHAGAIAAVALGAVLLAFVAAPATRDHARTADAETREALERSELHADLERAVDGLGARYVTSFGPAAVNRSYQTHLAWELKLRLGDVHGARGRGIVFAAPAEPVAGVVRVYRRARQRRLLAHVGRWHVSERPPHAQHVYKWPIVGFRLRTAAERVRNPSAGGVFHRGAQTRRIDRRGARDAAGART